jgi:hypothetical protein
MLDKKTYRSAMEHIQPDADIEEKILSSLQQKQNRNKKEGFYMKAKKMGLLYGGVAACLLLILGGYALFGSKANVPPKETVPPTTAKAIVNIDGIIAEVSEDGLSFRIGSLWVHVDENTIYGITGPNALPEEEQLVSKTFVVGNAVSGYTEDDTDSGSVYALRIYNNFPAQQ